MPEEGGIIAKKQPEDLTHIVKDDEYYKRVLDESMANIRVSGQELTKNDLSKEADRLARLVAENSNSQTVSRTCNQLLDEARNLLGAANLDLNAVITGYDKVKQRLLRAYESRKAQPKWFPLITIYNLLLLGIIAVVIIFYTLIPGQKNLENTAFVCLACVLWGGFGGVVDAFFALSTHFSKQDFDTQYWSWYYFHPLLGFSMGAIVYLLLQAGLLAISGMPLQEATANATADITSTTQAAATTKTGVTALPIAMAFLAGFKQSTAVEFISRTIKTIFQRQETPG